MSLSNKSKKNQLNPLNLSNEHLAELSNVEAVTRDFLENTYFDSTNKVVDGKVVLVDLKSKKVEIDCGLKNNCFLDLDEFEFSPDFDGEDSDSFSMNKIEVGQSVSVLLNSIDSKSRVGLDISREGAIRSEAMKKIKKAYETGEYVPGRALSNVNGGVFVAVYGCVAAFLPGSQIDTRPTRDISAIAGKNCQYKVIGYNFNENSSTIVLSRKEVVADERRKDAAEYLDTLKVGDIVQGYIKNMTDYGCFVDLGNVDGLAKIGDVANDPSEFHRKCSNYSIGDKIDVMILSIDREKNRVSLGIRQIEEGIDSKKVSEVQVGSVYDAVVKKITKYGCFIQAEGGIEGLLHLSEMTSVDKGDKVGGYNSNILRLIRPGQHLSVVAISSSGNSRLSFKLNRSENYSEDPCDKFIRSHKTGDIVKGLVSRIAPFGVFVTVGFDQNLESDRVESIVSNITDGLVHNNDILNNSNTQAYEVGQEINVVYISAEPATGKIRLGIGDVDKIMANNKNSNTTSSEESNIKEDQVLTCAVIATNQDGIEVESSDGFKFFIPKSQLSKEKTEQRSDRFNIGDRVDAKAIRQKNGSLGLSIRKFEEGELKRIIGQYGSESSGATIGNMLREVIAKHQKSEEDDDNNN